MKYIIDTDLLNNNDVGIAGSLYLLSLYFNNPINSKEEFEKVNNKGYIFTKSFFNNEPKDIELTPEGIAEVERILLESTIEEKTKDNKDRYIELANKLRDLYPKGRKEGTNLQWRDSAVIISTRLKAIVKKYDAKFTDEQAINATKKYIESFNGNFRFMQVLKYFIVKNKVVGGSVEQESQLLSYISNEGDDNTENNDWSAELR